MQSRNCQSKCQLTHVVNKHDWDYKCNKQMQSMSPTHQCLNENHIDLARGQNSPKC